MDENDIGMYVRPSLGTTQHLGEEQELVLFFLDIRDFTPFVETHLAFDIIHIIRKLFYVIQDVLYNNGGQIIETAGDGVYAVFGCENNRVKSVQSAVQSGLSILATIETLNATYFSTHFSTRIQIGIGIHIGSVISGTIRVGNIDHKVVMGFPVNVAARLQSATKELNNTLIVSSDIYEILPRTTFDLTPSSIVVKGVSTVLTVYLLGQPYR
jgi:adenylate cyclase